MKLTLSQAAKETGKSKSTLFRAIKSGLISAQIDGKVYLIDPVELFRVFEPIKNDETNETNRELAKRREPEHFRNESELYGTTETIAALQAHIDALTKINTELRGDLEQERQDRRNLLLMLTHQDSEDKKIEHHSNSGSWPLVVLVGILITLTVSSVIAIRLGLL
jgi:flagellar motility protein MotE (MotC chaperone)